MAFSYYLGRSAVRIECRLDAQEFDFSTPSYPLFLRWLALLSSSWTPTLLFVWFAQMIKLSKDFLPPVIFSFFDPSLSFPVMLSFDTILDFLIRKVSAKFFC